MTNTISIYLLCDLDGNTFDSHQKDIKNTL